jgi:tRNA(adenine34) deaminase
MNHEHYMRMALKEAEMAMTAGEFPVGCVLVHDGQVVVRGARQASRMDRCNELDHAEMVALRRLADQACTATPREISLYCTMEPCLMCLAALMLAGIGTIVYAYEDVMGGGAGLDFNGLPPLYAQRRPRIIGGVLRRDSLQLFQEFFANRRNDYWRGSLLADYTLAQELTAS